MRRVIDPVEASRRLSIIFPRQAFDTVLSQPLAGWAISALLYVDAVAPVDVDPPIWARPSTVLWQQRDVLEHKTSDEAREAWRRAAASGQRQLADLLRTWGMQMAPKYRENSRETLRDETLTQWRQMGAVRQRAGLATSSSRPRWALEDHFADLFDPDLIDDDLMAAIEAWTEEHLDAGARLKAQRARAAAIAEHEILVTLPDGKTRSLEPTESSQLLKGVIEEWAPRRLTDPVVLTISEPGAKILMEDRLLLSSLAIAIDVGDLLPDMVIVDVGTKPAEFWIVEAVASDGPISDRRKADLLAWAEEQSIRPDACRFLTAFASRGSAPARRRLKDLGTGTFAWFADEPERELSWDDIR